VLRVVRRRALPRTDPLTVVGVDDWAFRRNHRYGTIVCDLNRRQPRHLRRQRPSLRSTKRWFWNWDREAPELHCARAVWYGQNPRRPGIGAGRLPEGPQCLHDGRRSRARDERRLRALQKHLNTVKLPLKLSQIV
jgi:hypothetical protein